MTIIGINDVTNHIASTNSMFWYQGRLLRADKENNYSIIEQANCPIIQPGFKSDIQLDLKGIDTKDSKIVNTYEHKIYRHRIRIQEAPPDRVKDFIITLCKMHIEMLKHQVIAIDIHESNIVETIDGIMWMDWGAFKPLNKENATVAFVLTSYLASRYLFKTLQIDHEHVCLDDIKTKGGPLANIIDLDFMLEESWLKVIEIIRTYSTALETSHWSENYSNTMDIDHPESLMTKGSNVNNILQELDYDTVTDVGCNKGYYSFLAAKKAKSVIGFDLVPACVDAAQKFNQQFKLPAIFGTKTIESIRDNKMFETDRYKSDLVLALAIVHHVKNVITPTDFVRSLISLSNQYILLEDIGEADAYQQIFVSQGCELVKRMDSYPLPRSLSLYRKL